MCRFWNIKLNVVSLVMMIEYLLLDYNIKLTCAINEEYRAGPSNDSEDETLWSKVGNDSIF